MLTLQSNDFRNKEGSSEVKKRKLFFLTILVVISFILYTYRLFSMQVISGSSYRKQSQEISQRTKVLPAKRGEIYDRNATLPIVVNTDSFAVDIIPGEIPIEKYDTVTLKLSAMLDIDKSIIDKKIPISMRRSYTSVEVKSNVTFEQVANIAENLNDLPGISWRLKPMRTYVESIGSLSHIVGYVGDITKEELKVLYNQGYSNTSIIGKTGIEKQYDMMDDTWKGIFTLNENGTPVKLRKISN